MIAAACCEVMCLVVSLYWKISLHLTADGGRGRIAGGDEYRGRGRHDGSADDRHTLRRGAGFGRLYLGCHNGQQVLAGFCGGFAVAALAVLFL